MLKISKWLDDFSDIQIFSYKAIHDYIDVASLHTKRGWTQKAYFGSLSQQSYDFEHTR